MAEFVWKNTKLFIDGYDMSCDMNEMTMTPSADVLDRTTFCSSGRRRIAGLKDTQVTGSGFTNLADNKNDDVLYPRVGSTNEVCTIVPYPSSGNPIGGDRAYTLRVIAGEYTPGGSIGEVATMNFSLMGDGVAARGMVMHNSTALSSSAVATVYNLGVKKPKGSIVLGSQVRSVSSSGTEITLHVEQSSSTDFSTAKSTAITLALTDASAENGFYSSTALGSTTRGYYRVNLTVAGGSSDGTIDALIMVGLTQ